MPPQLQPGTILKVERVPTGECTVGDFVERRGSRHIYSVTCEGQPQHLVWNTDTTGVADARTSKLREMVGGIPPSLGFLWPKGLVLSDGASEIGFLGDPQPDTWCSLADVLCRRAPLSEGLRVAVGLELCSQWEVLHAARWRFLDFNPEDVLFHPKTGEVLHWVAESHVAGSESSESIPNPSRFTWPVVAQGGESSGTRADQHTLACVLFMLLVRRHPYEGSLWLRTHCLDRAKTKRVYWEEPRFMFGPGLEAHPLPPQIDDEVAARWDALPPHLRRLFQQALSTHQPTQSQRDVPLSEWRREMTLLQNSQHVCVKCRSELFFDHVAAGDRELACPHCGSLLKALLVLKIGSALIVLHPDKRIHGRHLVPNSARAHSDPVRAQVTRHRNAPDRWGLKNLGEASWKVMTPDGAELEVTTGKTVALTPGIRIDFGNVIGLVDSAAAPSQAGTTRDQTGLSLPHGHPESPSI